MNVPGGVMQASTRTNDVYLHKDISSYGVARTPIYGNYAEKPGGYMWGLEPQAFDARYEYGRKWK